MVLDASEYLVAIAAPEKAMSEFVDPVRAIQSIGPFRRYPVTMNGWTIPHLEAIETSQGVTLTLDHRFTLDLNDETAPGAVIWFVANAIAVAKGYACHPIKDGWADEDRLNPPANPRWPWVHLAPFSMTGLDDKREKS